MLKLCQTENAIQAQAIADLLLQHRIETEILNNYLAGALGEIPFMDTGPEIWLVDERDLSRAHALVQDYYEQLKQSVSNDSVYCRQCKAKNPANFETCWSCNASLSD